MSPADITVHGLNAWAIILLTLFNLGTAVWGTLSGPSRKNAARLDHLSGQLAAVEQRLAQVETKQAAMPSKEDMHELDLNMTKLLGKFDTMAEKLASQGEIMKRVEATVSRHEDHLLKKP